MEDKIRIAVIEDHPLVMVGLVSMCAQVPEWEVVLNGDELGSVNSLEVPADVVLLDLELNGKIVTVADVSAILNRGSRILIVSALASPDRVRTMLAAGVTGFASKHASTDSLIEGIWAAVRGDFWTSSELAALLERDPHRPQLSMQEQRALALYASGLKLQSVARMMDVKPSTVKEYIQRVRQKYEEVGRAAPTKIHLARNAEEDGIL
jgi:DNA-binding NarL/FixJ family response regulator